ncbi:hypothetical protein D9Q98_001943 [Chlorella vulgaris]|uniref:Uncharacterized protein n=1 Tax=Chlorella vulgaris TaxID=3077 RepID=A0A9D4Z073_CHLVU|nr:hypothetical protein D9Q98_001943 [Chlorella vulgaris]
MQTLHHCACRASIVRCDLSNARTTHQRTEAAAAGWRHLPPLRLLAAATAAASVLTASPQVHAYNVRVEDVESSTLQAGLRAANEGRLEDAERFFQIYLLQNPDSASVYSNLGNVHGQQQDYQQAVQDYDNAVRLAPTAPVPYLNRAVAKEALGVAAAAAGDSAGALAMWQSAAADCDRAIELDGKEFAAWFDRGNIDMRLGDYGAALTDFCTAADLAPGLAGYRLRHATLLFQQGDVAAARRMMQGVTRKSGNYSEAHAALAAVHWSQGDRERAEEEMLRAESQDERWGDMQWIRGSTRWPPRLEAAMERLLNIQDGQAP